MTRPTLLDLNPDEYNPGWHYYPFIVNLDRFIGSCNTLDDPYDKISVQNKMEYVILSVFNMTARIIVSKTLTKYISCTCKCKIHGRMCNSNQKWS